MLRYYSYYSVGGYKDFILGNSESKDESTFYCPLLPVLEERAKEDKEAEKQVSELQALPAIKQLSADNTYGMPASANVLFSHAGFKLIYKHLEEDTYAIALRDIMPSAKDEMGRSIPFLMVITGDEAEMRRMDILATYIACNIQSVEQFISQVLYMDADINGLRFDLAKFNEWVNDIIKLHPTNMLPCTSGGKKIYAYRNKVALLLLPDGISAEKAKSEQRIENNEILFVPMSEIITKENPEQLANQLMTMSEQLQKEKNRNKWLKRAIIASGVSGLIIGCLFSCHK